MDLRADAPAFVPTAEVLQQSECGSKQLSGDQLIRRLAASLPEAVKKGGTGTKELPGDVLIRQLASTMLSVRPDARLGATKASLTRGSQKATLIPAAGLFCPCCTAGETCAFHQLGRALPLPLPSRGYSEPDPEPALSGSARMRSDEDEQQCMGRPEGSRTRGLPPPPVGLAPLPPGLAPASAPPYGSCADDGGSLSWSEFDGTQEAMRAGDCGHSSAAQRWLDAGKDSSASEIDDWQEAVDDETLEHPVLSSTLCPLPYKSSLGAEFHPVWALSTCDASHVAHPLSGTPPRCSARRWAAKGGPR